MSTNTTSTLKPRTISWRVHFVDKAANGVITVGGMLVVAAVIGILVYIASQVFPMFAFPASGSVEVPKAIAPAGGKVLWTACDEYRRVAVTVDDSGEIRAVALTTGEVLSRTVPAGLGTAKITSVGGSNRPMGFIKMAGEYGDAPVYHLALGTSDGRIFAGTVAFLTDGVSYSPGSETAILKGLERPTHERFSAHDYLPKTVVYGSWSLPEVKVCREDLSGFSFKDFANDDRLAQAGIADGRELTPSSEVKLRHVQAYADIIQSGKPVLVSVGNRLLMNDGKPVTAQEFGALGRGGSPSEILALKDSGSPLTAADHVGNDVARIATLKAAGIAPETVLTAQHFVLHPALLGDGDGVAAGKRIGTLGVVLCDADDNPLTIKSFLATCGVTEALEGFGLFRRVRASVDFQRTVELDLGGEAVAKVAINTTRAELTASRVALVAAVTSSGKVFVAREDVSFKGMGKRKKLSIETMSAELTAKLPSPVAFVAVHEAANEAVFATEDGRVVPLLIKSVDSGLEVEEQAPPFNVLDGHSGEKLTAMGFVLGDSSLVFGTSDGHLETWFGVRESESAPPVFRRIHVLERGPAAVRGFSSSQKSKAFLVTFDDGTVRAHHMTSERTFFDSKIGSGGAPVVFFPPKTDGLIGWDLAGQLSHFWLDAPHAEISLKALFGKVHYEGYQKPEWEWQTSSGTDDVEPKLSLVPLLIGTLKGGIYALLFSVPLAVLAALYTSEFMNRKMRSIIKPAMEVMAALPSVVLGFIAALYIAPMVAPDMPAFLLALLVVPGLFLAFGWGWQQCPPSFTGKFTSRGQTIILFILLISGLFAAFALGPRVEPLLFPSREGADPQRLHPVSFEPRAFLKADTAEAWLMPGTGDVRKLEDPMAFTAAVEQPARKLAVGDFRGWTGGGRALPRPMRLDVPVLMKDGRDLGVVMSSPEGLWVREGEDSLKLLTGWDNYRITATNGETGARLARAEIVLAGADYRKLVSSGTLDLKPGQGANPISAKFTMPGGVAANPDWTLNFKDSKLTLRAADGTQVLTADSRAEPIAPYTLIDELPKGWWIPGGSNNLTLILLLLLVPLVGFLLKLIFSGGTVFGRSVHVFKPSMGIVHPAVMFEGLRARLEGPVRVGMRPVIVDMLFAVMKGAVVVAVALGLAMLLTKAFGFTVFRYDHPLGGTVADFRRFIIGEEGWPFQQTNSIVVGFVMGFAVIPIIYTISEDAMSFVPNQLRAASLACGASRWQTAVRVVLPAALPGIFSAIVIGLGRALGETMIVVMAAGGTPVKEFQPFNGFRSLSAAIAIELPEAAHGGTLFRTLFLAALLLFAMTFVINTFAEVVRIRLRKKLARL